MMLGCNSLYLWGATHIQEIKCHGENRTQLYPPHARCSDFCITELGCSEVIALSWICSPVDRFCWFLALTECCQCQKSHRYYHFQLNILKFACYKKTQKHNKNPGPKILCDTSGKVIAEGSLLDLLLSDLLCSEMILHMLLCPSVLPASSDPLSRQRSTTQKTSFLSTIQR